MSGFDGLRILPILIRDKAGLVDVLSLAQTPADGVHEGPKSEFGGEGAPEDFLQGIDSFRASSIRTGKLPQMYPRYRRAVTGTRRTSEENRLGTTVPSSLQARQGADNATHAPPPSTETRPQTATRSGRRYRSLDPVAARIAGGGSATTRRNTEMKTPARGRGYMLPSVHHAPQSQPMASMIAAASASN